jgi:hypothetical protein
MNHQAKDRAAFSAGMRCFLGCLVLLAGASARAEDTGRQTMDDAWWTGPLLAASASSLPHGHFLVEPYIYDIITYAHYDTQGRRVSSPHENDFGSQSYVLYGITDRISAGLIPRFGFKEASQGPSSTRVGVGDLTLQAQYRLTRFQEGSWVPTTSIVLGETLPTGKYDRLGEHPADGFGAGAYTTTVSLYSQDYFWLRNGRILRTRLDASYAFSHDVSLEGVSVYGTGTGFVGHARPGSSLTIDSSWEYSFTRNWVLALDVVYEHDANTRVTGNYPAGDGHGILPFQQNSGPSRSFGYAPAIEYNWSPRFGVIVGVRYIPTGHNINATVTPVAAINMVF